MRVPRLTPAEVPPPPAKRTRVPRQRVVAPPPPLLGPARLSGLALVGAAVLVASFLLFRPGPAALGTTPAPPSSPAAQAAAATPPTGTSEGEVLRMVSGPRSRSVLVQEPLTGAAPTGLVVVLGPHAVSAARTARDLALDQLRTAGFALAFPSTVDGDWNAGACCGASMRAQVDDVAFLNEVRTMLRDRYALPDARIGLIGYSTGGQMAYHLLCSSPRFAAKAVIIAGSLEAPCTPAADLPPTLIVHGLLDTTIPWAFTQRRTQLLDFAPRPGLTSAAAYATAGRCRSKVVDRTDGRWLLGYRGCTGIGGLTVVGMPDAGHSWNALWATRYATGFLTPLAPRT